ncbi:aromatic prenyltransferase [Streptomyces sp. NPDC052236]|uniref:aromatic prenyltransferase n=1 Tax=Streptomyces sp. NPDC052236 TaxID=3365686 RepID=UPI0037D1D937
MSENAELASLYSAIEESAGLLDIACSRARVWPILTAYGDAVPRAMIAFRVATDARHEKEFDCRISLPKDIDPYSRALSEGLITETGHPVGALLSDIQERCPIDSYGIDFGVVGGFKKIWVFFPEDDLQKLASLVGIPSMPRSLEENAGFFARHGLEDRVGLIGIDYHARTVNVYFGDLPGACLEPKSILSMHRDIGLPDPSEQMLKFCEQAFGIYTTLSWDSPKIKRISFSVITPDPMALPARLGPKIEQFVRSVPYGADDPKMVHAAVTSTGEEYYKLQSYYRWRPRKVNLMSSVDSAKDPA